MDYYDDWLWLSSLRKLYKNVRKLNGREQMQECEWDHKRNKLKKYNK